MLWRYRDGTYFLVKAFPQSKQGKGFSLVSSNAFRLGERTSSGYFNLRDLSCLCRCSSLAKRLPHLWHSFSSFLESAMSSIPSRCFVGAVSWRLDIQECDGPPSTNSVGHPDFQLLILWVQPRYWLCCWSPYSSVMLLHKVADIFVGGCF